MQAQRDVHAVPHANTPSYDLPVAGRARGLYKVLITEASARGLDLDIEVDGGIKLDNVDQVTRAAPT
jgi:hypothetical protein